MVAGGGVAGGGAGRLALGAPAGFPLAVSEGPQLTREVAGGGVPLLGDSP